MFWFVFQYDDNLNTPAYMKNYLTSHGGEQGPSRHAGLVITFIISLFCYACFSKQLLKDWDQIMKYTFFYYKNFTSTSSRNKKLRQSNFLKFSKFHGVKSLFSFDSCPVNVCFHLYWSERLFPHESNFSEENILI